MTDSLEMRKQLIRHLGNIAGYNDKGYIWSRHSPDEVRANQEPAQTIILRFVADIGGQAFSDQLLKQLTSGVAARDGSGDIHRQAKAELLPGE